MADPLADGRERQGFTSMEVLAILAGAPCVTLGDEYNALVAEGLKDRDDA